MRIFEDHEFVVSEIKSLVDKYMLIKLSRACICLDTVACCLLVSSRNRVENFHCSTPWQQEQIEPLQLIDRSLSTSQQMRVSFCVAIDLYLLDIVLCSVTVRLSAR